MDVSKEHIDVVNKIEDTKAVSISMCSTKNRRVKVAGAKLNQRILSKSVKCSCHLKYYKQERSQTTSNDQVLISSIPWHSTFIFLDPLLIGVLQVEYQNKKESPFDTYPVQMKTFLISICIYSTLLGIKIHTTQTRGGYQIQILSFVLLLSGSLSSASLLSILFQQPLLWVMLITWGLMPIILCGLLSKSSLCWILGTVAKFTWNVIDFMFATMVSMFNGNGKGSTSGSSNAYQTDRV
ncbi:unnamed protein product [Lupinus luteus]|uniref:Uncharacterized protein n=1 Tax=Lupinus luteus TaxID=3873 RepID=A0AAV1XUA0_LUPLU